jgi:anti-sigma factor RsiW
MNDKHLSHDDLALYVMDALAPSLSTALEAHVARCPACADALAREASFEVALHEVGAAGLGHRAAPRPVRLAPRPRLRRATTAAFAAALALAAGYLISIARSTHDVAHAAERASLVACPPGNDEAARACQARARRTGLYVQDPPWSAPIPIYEARTPASAVAPRR